MLAALGAKNACDEMPVVHPLPYAANLSAAGDIAHDSTLLTVRLPSAQKQPR